MIRNDFYKINTIDGDKYFKDNYSDTLYDYYVTGGIIFRYEVNISKEEYDKLFEIIYNILKTKLSEEEIKKAFLQYIQVIMEDARSGKQVDINYFINNTNNLSLDILDNHFLKKVKPLIKTIKNELIKEFKKNKRFH